MTKSVTSVAGIQQGVQLDMANPTNATQSPIILALTSQTKNDKGDCMQVLAKYAGIQYDQKYNLLLRGSQQLTLSEIFRYYGILTSTIRCPHCLKGISMDLIFLHLQKNFQNKGHRFTNQQVIQFFLDEDSGRNSEIIFKENNKHR